MHQPDFGRTRPKHRRGNQGTGQRPVGRQRYPLSAQQRQALPARGDSRARENPRAQLQSRRDHRDRRRHAGALRVPFHRARSGRRSDHPGTRLYALRLGDQPERRNPHHRGYQREQLPGYPRNAGRCGEPPHQGHRAQHPQQPHRLHPQRPEPPGHRRRRARERLLRHLRRRLWQARLRRRIQELRRKLPRTARPHRHLRQLLQALRDDWLAPGMDCRR